MTDPIPELDPRQDEAERARRAQRIADVTCALLAHSPGLQPREAIQLMAGARRAVLEIFPGRGATFDLLYRPRFLRILAERFPGPR